MLVMAESGGFARSPAGNKAVDALFYLPFDEFAKSLFIDATIAERSDDGGKGSSELHGDSLLLATGLPVPVHVPPPRAASAPALQGASRPRTP